MRVVERDRVGKVLDRNSHASFQISFEVNFEIEEKNGELRACEDVVDVRNIGWVHNDRPGILHCLNGRIVDGVNLGVESGCAIPSDTNLCALQSVFVEELRVIGKDLVTVCRGVWIAWVGYGAGNGAENYSGVSDHTSVGTDRVLMLGDWNNAGPAGEPDGWLDSDNPV